VPGPVSTFSLGVGRFTLVTVLNRSVLILRPKQPFLDWMAMDDAEGLAQEVFDDFTQDPEAYLVPEFEDQRTQDRVLGECWPELFERMLEAWSTDEGTWPERRTLWMFREWFEVQGFAIAKDLGDGEILDDQI